MQYLNTNTTITKSKHYENNWGYKYVKDIVRILYDIDMYTSFSVFFFWWWNITFVENFPKRDICLFLCLVTSNNSCDIPTSTNILTVSVTCDISISSRILTMSVTYSYHQLFWQCLWHIFIIKYHDNVCDISIWSKVLTMI